MTTDNVFQKLEHFVEARYFYFCTYSVSAYCGAILDFVAADEKSKLN